MGHRLKSAIVWGERMPSDSTMENWVCGFQTALQSEFKSHAKQCGQTQATVHVLLSEYSSVPVPASMTQ